MPDRRLSPRNLRCSGGRASILLGLALLLLLNIRPAVAHGGGTPQLTNAEAGPYLVSVWTEPDPIRVGELHVTVAVLEPREPSSSGREGGDLVLDATVQVDVRPVSPGSQTLVAYATRENAVNKLFYEADLDLPSEGQWRVDIQVEGPAGIGSTGFDIEAAPPAAINALEWLPWPVWAGLGLVLIAGGWSIHTFRSRDDRGPKITGRRTIDPSHQRSAASGHRKS